MFNIFADQKASKQRSLHPARIAVGNQRPKSLVRLLAGGVEPRGIVDAQKLAWRSIPSSSSISVNCAVTRSVWKAATLLQTHAATHERRVGSLVPRSSCWGLSRHKSGITANVE